VTVVNPRHEKALVTVGVHEDILASLGAFHRLQQR
jgi:hypothetical protein